METGVTGKSQLEIVHNFCIEKGFAFVSYRLPGSNELSTIVQYRKQVETYSDIKSIKAEKGFIVAPFDMQSGHPVYFIQPDVHFTINNYDDLLIKELAQADPLYKENAKSELSEMFPASGFEEYKNRVIQAKEAIRKGNAGKVVVSRISPENKHSNFNAAELLNALKEEYHEAFVYLFYIPGAGLWCGATPEPLVSISNGFVSTISLAATRKFNESSAEEIWNEKEIEEQGIVTQYIRSLLDDFSIKNYQMNGPDSQQAGNLVHLKTSFIFPVDALNNHLFEFIQELHPTPSVCGFPKNEAMQHLRLIEQHDREYYTGFLGTVNFSGETRLFVNLRCMKIKSHNLVLYLGAGITAGSDPEEEWEETNLKKMTLLIIIERLNQTQVNDGK